jgi:hypothetical protein
MSILGRSASYSPELCELAHDDCLLGATNDELAALFGVIDDIALLDAAGESMRHAGDCAGARPLGETAKRAAERAQRAETSNPSEIAAFSTTARGGGNRRKLAETPCGDFARETVRIFPASLWGPLHWRSTSGVAEIAEIPRVGRTTGANGYSRRDDGNWHMR